MFTITNFIGLIFLIALAVVSQVKSSSLRVKHYAQEDGGNDECRPKHGPHGPHMPEEICCELPKLFKDVDAIVEECVKETEGDFPPPPPGGSDDQRPLPPPGGDGNPPPHGPPGGHRHMFPCVHECIFNKTGLNGADGKVNKAATKAKFTERFSTDDGTGWSSIGQAAVAKCLDGELAATPDPNKHRCISGAHETMRCIKREMFINCPANKWVESEDCNNIKSHLIKCPMGGPPMM
ncbi:uncharacterized protein LOC142327643 [Lycorma delicatula]|uniref:uncharacterized protein LOC142327643 n=1 Tax=Lycorma delicatula TaxID=130591 RepID=UPI003F514FB0